MRFPFIGQQDMMDCGPTCLAMVCKYYKKAIPRQFLRERTEIGKEGVNMLGISEVAEEIGFRTQATQLSVDALSRDALLPCILHWDQNHFVILYKVRKNKFYVADPKGGLIEYASAEFKDHWVSIRNKGIEEGIALLLEPTPFLQDFEPSLEDTDGVRDTKNINTEGVTLGQIFEYILPHKKLVFQLFFGLGAVSLIQLLLPFLTQNLVDIGINTSNIHFIYIILLAQLALITGRLVIEFIRGWALLHISSRINLSILSDFFIKLMKLPVSFFDSKKTGDIMQRMNDHQRIESFLTGSSINMIFSVVNFFIFSFVLIHFNPGIFAVFIAASTVYSLWIFLFMKKRKTLDFKRFDLSARKQSLTIQLIQGMQEIKLNGVEKPMRWGWERLQTKIFKLGMTGLALNQWQQTGAFFINESKNIIISFLSAKAVIDGDMTLGAMLTVQYILGQLNSPIEQLVGFFQSWQNAKISLDRLNEIHGLKDEEPFNEGLVKELPPAFARQLSGGKNWEIGQFTDETRYEMTYETGIKTEQPTQLPATTDNLHSMNFGDAALRLENLSYRYAGSGNEPVLKNINMIIPKGKITAIVGVSGSGKTTLLKLLLKFYPLLEGEIMLDPGVSVRNEKGIRHVKGTKLSHISHKVWRSHCSAVMQESYIFSDTIARNIAVGLEKIDMERLYCAIEAANIWEFIESLPLGLNTKIGPDGGGVSMGQRQRILLARAIYRDSPFVFLDEATNSLDANNESVIMKNLESFFVGKTVVVVAHRLSTVKNADQIIVLKRGEIVETGTHQELVKLKGEYFSLVKNQLELGN